MAERIEQALNDIREAAGGVGSTMHLSALGNRLIEAGIDFRAESGQRKLSDMLQRMSDFCGIEGPLVRFRAGAPHAAPAPAAPGSPAASPTLRLSGDLWRAMVVDRPDRAFFYDLATDTIVEVPVTDGAPGEPVASEPVRFIRVPTLPSDEQVSIAQASLQGMVSQEDFEAIFGAGPGWMRRAHDLLPPALSGAMDDARQIAVVNAAQSWLAQHDLPAQKFVRNERKSATQGGKTRRPPFDRDLEIHLRNRLHEVLDAMTLSELLELRIPARFSLP